ncbi:MAG: hypothetical protein H6618_01610 [Deltaproteobacteria bacterium]|nr:hypothetical protein [Deltaproteobacteria bacterium]
MSLTLIILLSGGASFSAGRGSSGTDPLQRPGVLSLDENKPTRVEVHPFLKNSFKQGLPSYSLSPMKPEDRVRLLLRQYLLHPDVSAVRIRPANPQDPVSGLYLYQLDGITFCDYELRIRQSKDGQLSALGAFPDLNPAAMSVSQREWPQASETWHNIRQQIGEDSSQIHEVSRKLCYLTTAERADPIPVYEYILRIKGLPFRVQADEDQIYRRDALWLASVTGTSRSYEKNPRDGKTEDNIVTLDGSGYLQNDNLRTSTRDHFRNKDSGISRVFSEEQNFIYETDSNGFQEASVFNNAFKMLEFFKGLGFSPGDRKPIRLVIHADFDGDKNNALYEPPASFNDQYATISVGNGDGTILQHLALDTDVIRHELSHHIVYQTLTNVVGEALILHEGLADYFTFSATGDACLGESICPEESAVCVIPATKEHPEHISCLRSGEIDFQYGDELYQAYKPHTKGQIISGLLWKSGKSIGHDKVTAIVFRAISFLVRDSGFRDFLMSLLLADQELNQGQNACELFDTAISFGLDSFLSGVDCQQSDTWIAPEYQSTEVTPQQQSSEEDSSGGGKRNWLGCGVLGSQHENEISRLLQAILLFLPLCAGLFLRQKRQDTGALDDKK